MSEVIDAAGPVVWIAPSDLTFLLNECIRCFFLKVVLGRRRPPGPFPRVFRDIDREQRRYFDGRRTADIDPSLMDGVLSCKELRVKSAPLRMESRKRAIAFRGALDAVVHFEDGSYGIIDFKTTVPSAEHAEFYAAQLMAYSYALQNPAANSPLLAPVSALGLLCFQPTEMLLLDDGDLALRTHPTWVEIERKDEEFVQLLSLVTEIVDWPEPPKPDAACSWCKALLGAAA